MSVRTQCGLLISAQTPEGKPRHPMFDETIPKYHKVVIDRQLLFFYLLLM